MKVVMLDNQESSEGVVGWFGRFRRFLVDVRAELSRVTWPTRREVWATTIVVILVSALIGAYLFIVDLGLNKFIEWIFSRFGAA
jgi:preprotein translocase subunit SecE